MQTRIKTTKPKGGNGRVSPRGRKDQNNGQEAAIPLRPIKNGMEELVALYLQEREAAAEEEAGLRANVARKFVKARAGEKFEEAKWTAEQLSLVFEEIGEA